MSIKIENGGGNKIFPLMDSKIRMVSVWGLHVSSRHLDQRSFCYTLCPWMAISLEYVFEWFLSCVGPIMFLAGNWIREALVKLDAAKCFFPVYPLMHLQITWLWEDLRTLCSPEWFLSCVGPSIIMYPKWLECEKLLSHFVHWNGLSPLCGLSCIMNWPEYEKFLSQFVHLLIAFLLPGHVFKWVFSSYMKMRNIWMVFLLCGSSNVPKNDISDMCFLSCIFKALG